MKQTATAPIVTGFALALSATMEPHQILVVLEPAQVMAAFKVQPVDVTNEGLNMKTKMILFSLLLFLASCGNGGSFSYNGESVEITEASNWIEGGGSRVFLFKVKTDAKVDSRVIPDDFLFILKTHGADQKHSDGYTTTSIYYWAHLDTPEISGAPSREKALDLAFGGVPIANVWITTTGGITAASMPDGGW